MGTGRKRRENEDHSWTMESLPTRYPAGRGSTAGMASDMIGPRWKRRSFVGDGIPADQALPGTTTQKETHKTEKKHRKIIKNT